MNHDIDNIVFEQDKKGYLLVENKTIQAITDLEALGVYTYMKMLIDEGLMKVTDISEGVCKHFSMTEKRFLENVKFLNDLGFMMIIKK
jgi:hypothetical protein